MDQSLISAPPNMCLISRCHSFSSSCFIEQGQEIQPLVAAGWLGGARAALSAALTVGRCPAPSAGPEAKGDAGTGAIGQHSYPPAAAFASLPAHQDGARGDLQLPKANPAPSWLPAPMHTTPRANHFTLLGPKSLLQKENLFLFPCRVDSKIKCRQAQTQPLPVRCQRELLRKGWMG